MYNVFTIATVLNVLIVTEITSAGLSTSALVNTPTTDAPPTSLSTGIYYYPVRVCAAGLTSIFFALAFLSIGSAIGVSISVLFAVVLLAVIVVLVYIVFRHNRGKEQPDDVEQYEEEMSGAAVTAQVHPEAVPAKETERPEIQTEIYDHSKRNEQGLQAEKSQSFSRHDNGQGLEQPKTERLITDV